MSHSTSVDQQSERTASQPKIKWSLFIFLAVLLVAPIIALAGPERLLDMAEFYIPMLMVLHGQGSAIYQPSAVHMMEHQIFPSAQEILLFVPPPGVVLLLPDALIPAGAFRITWWCLLLTLTGISIWLLQSAFKFSEKILVRFCAFIAATAGNWEIMKHGQIAPFLLLGLSAAILAFVEGHELLAGCSLGLLILKPQYLAPLLSFLLGARQWKPIVCLLAVAAILSAIAALLIGVDGYKSYSNLMSYSLLQNRTQMAPEFGPTIRGQLLLLFPHEDAHILIFASIIQALAYLTLFALGHKARNHRKWIELWLISSLPLGMLTSLHTHNYDFLLLTPVVASLIKLGFFSHVKAAQIATYIFGVLLLIPVYAFLQYYFLLRGAQLNPFVIGLALFSWAMIATTWRHLRSSDNAS